MKSRLFYPLFQFCLIGVLAISTLVSQAQTVDQNVSLCEGKFFRGIKINIDTAILIQNPNPSSPDTLFTIHAIPRVKTFLNKVLCPGESFMGMQFSKDTIVVRIYAHPETGCDSIVYHVLTVKQNNSLIITGDTAFCIGENRILSVGFYPGYVWSTGETIREKKVTTSGTYTISVTDVDGCLLVSSIKVMVSAPESTSEALSPNCPDINDGMIELFPSNGIAPYQFSLNGQPQQQNGLFSGLTPGSYTIALSDAIGCRDTTTIMLDEPEPLSVKVQEDIILTAGDNVLPDVTITGTPSAITWSPAGGLSCTDCPSPEMMPVLSTRYVVNVTNDSGCMVSDTVMVTIDDNRKIYIPNVFQPDVEPFTIFSGEGVVEVISFRVFNRWGELMHQVKNQQPGEAQLSWNGEFNGKKLPPDVYLYEAQVLFGDGENKMYNGDVLLLRQ